MNEYCKTCAEIDLAALKDNYRKIEKHIKNGAYDCKMLSVVKANAYGHGAIECARALSDCGAEYFGVATIGEALQLRNNFSEPDILILGYTSPELAETLINNNITQTVFSSEYAKNLCEFIPAGKRLRAHIKLNTGMNRIGFEPDDQGVSEILEISKTGKFNFTGIFTHFACSDEPDRNFTLKQLEKYNYAVSALSNKGVETGLHHVCNSAGTIDYPEAHFDMSRCGIILYGLKPSKTTSDLSLTPVMTLKTTVSHIHTVKAGDSVSYGATFHAKRDTRVVTMPIGYADGFIRAYSPGGTVMINGYRAPLVGRICMDQCMADITDYDKDTEIKPGCEVLLFGKDKPVEEFSDLAKTINYETVCLISSRVPRIYLL